MNLICSLHITCTTLLCGSGNDVLSEELTARLLDSHVVFSLHEIYRHRSSHSKLSCSMSHKLLFSLAGKDNYRMKEKKGQGRRKAPAKLP